MTLGITWLNRLVVAAMIQIGASVPLLGQDAPKMPTTYGSYAISEGTVGNRSQYATGISYDWPTREQADFTAINNCIRAGGVRCAIDGRFLGGACGYVTSGWSQTGYCAGSGPTPARAQAVCQSRGCACGPAQGGCTRPNAADRAAWEAWSNEQARKATKQVEDTFAAIDALRDQLRREREKADSEANDPTRGTSKTPPPQTPPQPPTNKTASLPVQPPTPPNQTLGQPLVARGPPPTKQPPLDVVMAPPRNVVTNPVAGSGTGSGSTGAKIASNTNGGTQPNQTASNPTTSTGAGAVPRRQQRNSANTAAPLEVVISPPQTPTRPVTTTADANSGNTGANAGAPTGGGPQVGRTAPNVTSAGAEPQNAGGQANSTAQYAIAEPPRAANGPIASLAGGNSGGTGPQSTTSNPTGDTQTRQLAPAVIAPVVVGTPIPRDGGSPANTARPAVGLSPLPTGALPATPDVNSGGAQATAANPTRGSQTKGPPPTVAAPVVVGAGNSHDAGTLANSAAPPMVAPPPQILPASPNANSGGPQATASNPNAGGAKTNQPLATVAPVWTAGSPQSTAQIAGTAVPGNAGTKTTSNNGASATRPNIGVQPAIEIYLGSPQTATANSGSTGPNTASNSDGGQLTTPAPTAITPPLPTAKPNTNTDSITASKESTTAVTLEQSLTPPPPPLPTAAMSNAKAVVEPEFGQEDDIAMGLGKHREQDTWTLLKNFARQIQRKQSRRVLVYDDIFGLSPGAFEELRPQLIKMMSVAHEIHFNLDNFKLDRFQEFVSKDADIGQDNVTNWELKTILENPDFRHKIRCYDKTEQGAGKAPCPPAIPTDEDITRFRKTLKNEDGNPVTENTLGVAFTNVPGLEKNLYEGASTIPRRKAHRPDLDTLHNIDRPIKAPSDPDETPMQAARLAQFRDHAEEDIANAFVKDVDPLIESGSVPADLDGYTLNIRVSQTVCTRCVEGMGPYARSGNDGVLKQLSKRYPGLTIHVEAQGGNAYNGRAALEIRDGRFLE